MISAIVLSAGASRRMGSTKPLLFLRGKPMLELVLNTLRRSAVDEVVVVLGKDARRIRTKVRFKGEKIAYNRQYALGLSGSLKAGLNAVSEKSDAAIILLGDQPFVRPATVNKILKEYQKTNALIVAPVYDGVRGNPVLFDRTLFPQVKRVKGDVGAKAVVRRNKKHLKEVKVNDEGVVLDIDTPSDYRDVSGRRG